MKCGDIKNLLSPYLEGELEQKEKQELESHLQKCLSCRKELSLLKAAIQSVKDLEEVAPPANLLAKINEELDKRPLKHRLRLIRDQLSFPLGMPALAKSLALAASILLILYLSIGPGKFYFSPNKVPSLVEPPPQATLKKVVEPELAIPQPAANIPRPGSYCIAPAKMAEVRKKFGPFDSDGFNNPSGMAQVRQGI